MYMNLLTPFIKGRDWFMDYHNICVNPRYVYLDKHTGKAYFIYVPEKNSQNTDEEILKFFKKVFTSATITDDKDFQVRLFRYFTNGSITLMGLYQIFQEENELVPQSVKRVEKEVPVHSELNIKQTPILNYEDSSSKQEKIQVEEEKSGGKSFFDSLINKKDKDTKKKNESDDFMFGGGDDFLKDFDQISEDIFGGTDKKKGKDKGKDKTKDLENGKKGFFGIKKNVVPAKGEQKDSWKPQAEKKDSWKSQTEKKKVYEDSDNSGWLDNSMFPSDETEISGGSSSYVSVYLELIESPIAGVMRRINLDFQGDYVIIGRNSSDQVKPDIAFPSEFKRMGRQHARIERRGGKYYIIDLGSANHTFLNGRVLAPNQPYQLEDGMELGFTDKTVSYRVRL